MARKETRGTTFTRGQAATSNDSVKDVLRSVERRLRRIARKRERRGSKLAYKAAADRLHRLVR